MTVFKQNVKVQQALKKQQCLNSSVSPWQLSSFYNFKDNGIEGTPVNHDLKSIVSDELLVSMASHQMKTPTLAALLSIRHDEAKEDEKDTGNIKKQKKIKVK